MWLKMSHFGQGIVQCLPNLTSIQDLFQPNSWQTPVAAVTVYSAPDDGRRGRLFWMFSLPIPASFRTQLFSIQTATRPLYHTPYMSHLRWALFSLKLCTDRQPRTLVQSDSTICCICTYNYVLLKMSTWCSKHVEENGILWINNNQCIKFVINV